VGKFDHGRYGSTRCEFFRSEPKLACLYSQWGSRCILSWDAFGEQPFPPPCISHKTVYACSAACKVRVQALVHAANFFKRLLVRIITDSMLANTRTSA